MPSPIMLTHGHESCGDDLIESDKEEETDKGDIEKNNTSKNSNNLYMDYYINNLTVGIGHKRRRKVKFDYSLQSTVQSPVFS
jgi:hypothetical protein